MSYLVLARKYRPVDFDGFVGQDVIAETLRNAIRRDRVAHAYLFAGPRGVGKTSMARVFAKALNCVNGPTADPCNECDHCKAIGLGQDVDVIEIDGASNRGIDEIRDIRQNARYVAARSRFKIYYIDEVHMLTEQAFNALLKTLEEPPSHVKFIFATTAAVKLPETILSRVQRFDFRRITNTDIAKKLEEICAQEGVNAPQDVLLLVARRARGSMRDGLSLLDQILSFCGDTIEHDAVADMLGVVGDSRMAALISMTAKRDTAGLLRAADDMLALGMDVGEILDQVLAYLRDLLVGRVCGPDPDLLDRPPDAAAAVVEVAKDLDPEQILYMGQILNRARRRVREGQDGRVVLEMSLAKLVQSGGIVPMGQVLERLAALEEAIEASAASPPGQPSLRKPRQHSFVSDDTLVVRERPAAPDQSPGTVRSEPERGPKRPEDDAAATSPHADLWRRFLERIHDSSLLLYSILRGARLERVEDGVAVVVFPEARRSHHDEVETPENKKMLEGVLSELCGAPTRLRIANGEDRPTEPPSPPTAREPIVQEVLDVFGGGVIGDEGKNDRPGG